MIIIKHMSWSLKFCCNENIERNVISIVSRPILILE